MARSSASLRLREARQPGREPQQRARKGEQPRGPAERAPDGAAQFRRRHRRAVAHGVGPALRRAGKAGENRVYQVADVDQAAAVLDARQRQRPATVDGAHQREEVRFDARAVDERRAQDDRLEAGEAEERLLGLQLRAAVGVIRLRRLERAEVDEAPCARRERHARLRDRALHVDALQFRGTRGGVRDVREVHDRIAAFHRRAQFMPCGGERQAEMAADEAAGAGDEDAHVQLPPCSTAR